MVSIWDLTWDFQSLDPTKGYTLLLLTKGSGILLRDPAGSLMFWPDPAYLSQISPRTYGTGSLLRDPAVYYRIRPDPLYFDRIRPIVNRSD